MSINAGFRQSTIGTMKGTEEHEPVQIKEASRALPMHFYRDPAEVVEVNELSMLGCRACDHGHQIIERTYCTEPKNDRQKGVPRIGHRCRWFKLKGKK